MKFNLNINLPQKSLFGFEILSSLQSSLSCYLLLIFGRFLNPLFGSNKIQTTSASLFNVLLNVSIIVLIINLIIKRRQLKKHYFFLLNTFLFIYLPVATYFVFRYLENLTFIWKIFEL